MGVSSTRQRIRMYIIALFADLAMMSYRLLKIKNMIIIMIISPPLLFFYVRYLRQRQKIYWARSFLLVDIVLRVFFFGAGSSPARPVTSLTAVAHVTVDEDLEPSPLKLACLF